MICRTNENEERMFMERENNDEIEIDLLEVAGELWRHFWVIVLSMIVFGAAAFSYANFLITPLYHPDGSECSPESGRYVYRYFEVQTNIRRCD